MADRGLQTAGQAAHEITQGGGIERGPGAVFVHLGAEADVGANAVVEQHHVLPDIGNLLAQAVQTPVAQRHAVEQQSAPSGLQQARHQAHERGLARAGRADEREAFACLHAQPNAVKHRAVHGTEGDAHIVKLKVAAHTLSGVRASVLLSRRIHNAAQTVEGAERAHHRLDDVGHTTQGRERHHHRGDERHKPAHAVLPRHIALPHGKHDDHRNRQRRQPLRYRRGRGARHQRFHRGAAQRLVDAIEPSGKTALRVVHTNHRRGQHALLQRVGGFFRRLLHLRIQALGAAADDAHGENQRQQNAQGQQRQTPVDPQQIAEQGDQGEAVAHQREQARKDHAKRQLRLIHRRPDQAAGALALELRQLRVHNLPVNQFPHPREHVLRQPLSEKLRSQPRQTPYREQAHEHRRHSPQGKVPLRREAHVEHMLHQGWEHRLGRCHNRGEEHDEQGGGAVARVGFKKLPQQTNRRARRSQTSFRHIEHSCL